MNSYAPGTGTSWSANDPVCRVAWNAWSSQVEAVAVWNPPTWAWDTVRPAGRFASEVQAAKDAWNTSDELASTVEALLDPEILTVKLIQATAQVAALHAGFPAPVARLVGHIAGKIGEYILGQDQRASRAQVARWAEFAFAAETGAWIATSTLKEHDIARISELLGPDGHNPAPKPIVVEPQPIEVQPEPNVEPQPKVEPHEGFGFSP